MSRDESAQRPSSSPVTVANPRRTRLVRQLAQAEQGARREDA